MGTVRRLGDERILAVRRYRYGESVKQIAVSLGRSPWWVYKWLARAAPGRSGLGDRPLAALPHRDHAGPAAGAAQQVPLAASWRMSLSRVRSAPIVRS